MPLPEIVLPGGQTVMLLYPQLTAQFGNWPPPKQRKAIRLIEEFLQEIYADGSILHMAKLGVLPADLDLKQLPPHAELRARVDMIDKCSWQLAQFLRYSTPTRISEAVPPLTVVLNGYKVLPEAKSKIDVVPSLYLAVALSKIPGEEERAIRVFKETIVNIYSSNPSEMPVKNLLWARANAARLFRHLNRVPEAEEQEGTVRTWILTHPYAYPPSGLRDILRDEDETGAHILDHEDVVRHFSGWSELAPGISVMVG